MNPHPASAPGPAETGAPGTTAPTAEHTLLIVDDSAMDRHLAGAIVHKLAGWRATFAANGVEALASIAQEAPDLVLTDMLMPEMDGLDLVQAVRSRYPLVPVILMTAHGSEDVAIQALQKGAASYVPKKSLARDLGETLEQVLGAARTSRGQQRILESLSRHETHFELENDPSLVPALVGFLEENISRVKLCEPSGLILLGVALHEALTNAIVHGNLDLSSELRESDEKLYQRLLVERRTQEPYRDRRVHVQATLSRHEAVFVVRDDGAGFDPATLPDPTDPANLGKVSGRGLLLIQTFMDRVQHNDVGNQITMIKRRGG
jgi:CheY-like chemotaxis protein/anti-sigma regulatory factor (Ser/Thr protein kinase)